MFARRAARWVSVRAFSSEVTGLYDFHVRHGGKMVNFGGYMLPVQYSDLGIAASHLHTRKSASLFDVSHMMQTEIVGPDSIPFMETLTTADLHALAPATAALTLFPSSTGGILDDLIVSKITPEHLHVVSNAAMRVQDRALLEAALHRTGLKLRMRCFEPKERALVALQGPKAAEALQRHVPDVELARVPFMGSSEATVAGCGACRITRCGYTGEDGFEVSIPGVKVEDVAEALLGEEEVRLAGLGARDSLRLEAGLCLYGSDITPSTTPIEAALTWLIAKRRRKTRDFPGADVMLAQIANGAERKRVGIVAEGGPPARHGTPVLDGDGVQVGEVTSGCPAPSLGKNIAMAYVPVGLAKVGTRLRLKVRDKVYEAAVAKMPFVATKYYKGR